MGNIHASVGLWPLYWRDVVFFILAIVGYYKWGRTPNYKGVALMLKSRVDELLNTINEAYESDIHGCHNTIQKFVHREYLKKELLDGE